MRRRGADGQRNGSGEQSAIQLRTGRVQLRRAIRVWRVLPAMVHGIVPVTAVQADDGYGDDGVCGVNSIML